VDNPPDMSTQRSFLKFAVTGGVCFGVNLAILYVGTSMLGWHYLLSMMVSIASVTALGWAMNRQWTFRVARPPSIGEFARYSGVTFLSCAIALGLMALLVSGLGIHYLVANMSIAAAMTSVNFIAHKDWSFRRAR
jgi:putative flippase GtrA